MFHKMLIKRFTTWPTLEDCVLLSETSAITSCIEFPVLGPTLLATQIWERQASEGAVAKLVGL